MSEYKYDKIINALGIQKTSFKGDKGDKGDSIKGDKGEPGKDGRDGKDGKDGKIGKQGPKGERGLTGKTGRDGKDGADGQDGSPDSGVDIVGKINDIPLGSPAKIDASHIKNLPDMVASVAQEFAPRSGNVTTSLLEQYFAYLGSLKGLNTTLGYDANDNLITKTIPSIGITLTYSYDGSGNLTTVTDGTYTKTLAYDGSGNLVTITYS